MFGLASMLYAVIGTTLAGISILVILVAGFDTQEPILMTAATGALLGLSVLCLLLTKSVCITC